MTIDMLICHIDGTQELVRREVPESYFQVPEEDSPKDA